MASLLSTAVFQSYALFASLAAVILLGLGLVTALTRISRKMVINHEDAKINGGAKVADLEHADVARVKRAHQNALESSVPFFVLGFLYTQTDPSVVMAQSLFAVFVVARLLHAVFYIKAIQPFRTLSFFAATIVNVTMLVQVLRAVL